MINDQTEAFDATIRPPGLMRMLWLFSSELFGLIEATSNCWFVAGGWACRSGA